MELILQTLLSPLSQGLWTPNLARWWHRMGDPNLKVKWHFDIVVTWQIKRIISPFSQSLWIPSLPGWWLRKRGPYLQNHVTHLPSVHATNQKRYISSFARPVDPKYSRLVTLDEAIPRKKSRDTSIKMSCDKLKIFHFHFHKGP